MVARESDVRMIGYGAMLIEGLVGVVALFAAAALPQGDYWAINIDLAQAEKYSAALTTTLGADRDDLAKLEEQVGGESLRGRTGGAVTLAVGMSRVFSEATRRVAGDGVPIEAVIKYWYHFAIMFEALFILTTIDAGTRVARFLLQEALGKIYKPFERADWLPGALIATGLITAGWGGLIASGSIDTIWPMFGIANQMLAVIALSVVTSVMINAGPRALCRDHNFADVLCRHHHGNRQLPNDPGQVLDDGLRRPETREQRQSDQGRLEHLFHVVHRAGRRP